VAVPLTEGLGVGFTGERRLDARRHSLEALGHTRTSSKKLFLVVRLERRDQGLFQLTRDLHERYELGVVAKNKLVTFIEAREELEQDERFIIREGKGDVAHVRMILALRKPMTKASGVEGRVARNGGGYAFDA
jgi:hypothetical protein